MQSRSISRELALLLLGQISSEHHLNKVNSLKLDDLLYLGFETLSSHWHNQLENCAMKIDSVYQRINQIEDYDKKEILNSQKTLQDSLRQSEEILNSLSDSIELSKLLALSHQDNIKKDAMNRVNIVLNHISSIDSSLNEVMEGWRLKRLPRIDQDILRLTFVDLYHLKTPIAVACNEAVSLANRYSDQQGRKMINGILRRLQNYSSKKTA